MTDRAQSEKPSRADKIKKEVIPIITEAAVVLLMNDRLGPLSNPDMAQQLVNFILVYGTGTVAGMMTEYTFSKATNENFSTGTSFVKGLLTAAATSYLMYRPDIPMLNDVGETVGQLGTIVGQGVSDVLQDIGQKLTTPTISPEQIAQLQSDIQNRQETFYPDLSPLGTVIGLALPVGIGVRLLGIKFAEKYKEAKKNLGTAFELSRDFFSKLRNIGNRSPESVLSDIQAQISTLEAELKAIKINPDIAPEADAFADKIHLTIGHLSKLEARIRLEARVTRTTHSRRRSHLG